MWIKKHRQIDRQTETHLMASFPGPEPSSVDANVYVWRYTLLVVHARKEGFQDNLGKPNRNAYYNIIISQNQSQVSAIPNNNQQA